jgi:acetate kinase
MSDAVFLTLNAGSSSVKFAVYAAGADPIEIARGQIENLGDTARLKMLGEGIDLCREDIGKADHNTAMVAILDHLGPF